MKRLLPLLLTPVFPVSAAVETPKPLATFLEQHCSKCHDSETKKGDLDLSALPYDLSAPEYFREWRDVFDRVLTGEMPPKKKTQPAADEREKFLRSLYGDLKTVDAAQEAKVGRVQARHLTRSEFERSVQDVLGIYVPLQSRLPDDPLTDGFTTVAKGQQISSNQLETYLGVVDFALDTAFRQALSPADQWKTTLTWKDMERQPLGPVNRARGPEGRPTKQDVVAWTGNSEFYGRIDATKVPASGWYRIRIRAMAVNPPNGGRVCASIFSGPHVSSAPVREWVGSIEADLTPTDYEFFAWMNGGDLLRIRPADNTLKQVSGHRHPMTREVFADLDGLDFPGVAMQTIEMERVYPGFKPADTRRNIFGDLPLAPTPATTTEVGAKTGKKSAPANQIAPKDQRNDLTRLIYAFASRAFRRPLSAPEIQDYLKLANAKLATGASFTEALRTAYRLILTSPRFFYFEEAPGSLDDHALASRLSYFLWSAPPDNELRKIAEAGKLKDPAMLRAQTERLLAHPNAARFIRNFTDQWLKLGEIDATDPDHKLYREYDDTLRNAMIEETRAYFRDLIERDLTVKNLVDSNYAFVNTRLAKHYGLPVPPTAGLQPVSLTPEQHRGGIITQASILKVTANGTTTSPVVRGIWMLDRIMGQTVPPPPPNVPAVEPDIRGATSIRDQLDKHRTQEACAACHIKIDPPGFALENYDVIGGWRQNYRATDEKGSLKQGPKVDPSYELADGSSFADITAFKQLLLKKPDQLARNLTRQLITYSTGAPPTFADREKIEAIITAAKAKDYGVRTLIHEIVKSPIFLNK
jgi:hypothetical protein